LTEHGITPDFDFRSSHYSRPADRWLGFLGFGEIAFVIVDQE